MPFIGGRREKAKLKFGEEFYTPTGAKALEKKELRKEYSRMRSIAQKRLKRFKGTEWEDSQLYMRHAEGFPTLKEIKSDAQLRHEFSDLARFITSQRSSVSGLEKERRKAVKTLQERGYDFVTKENFREFAEFMEYARTANMGRLYDSKRIADFYEAQEKKDKSAREIQAAYLEWIEKRKDEEKEKVQNRKKRDSKQYRKALE